MTQTCTICSHPERIKIDVALVGGASTRDIAGQYGVGKSSVDRHKKRHLSPLLAASSDQIGQTLWEQIVVLNDATLTVLGQAQQNPKGGYLVLRAVEQARANLELIAELLSQLDRAPAVNVFVSPVWTQLERVLMEALAGHPEARLAVTERLAALEERTP